MVAKTIGTHVSFAWETVKGVRPTTGYKKWCDATSHPDLNPEADQIETTTLCQEHNHTYEDGLVDYGTLEFGSNMTPETFDLFLGDDGYAVIYNEKSALGLGLWVCIDIKGWDKSYYIPVKPQPFGLPEGEAGSNKYDLTVRFSVTGDAGWFDDPIYDDEKAYQVTLTGYGANDVKIDILNANRIVKTVVTSGETMVIELTDGEYVAVGRKDGNDPQIKELKVSGNNTTVTFETFAY